MTKPDTYWSGFGSNWNLIGPPLRPCPEDIAIMEQMVGKRAGPAGLISPQAVILGVTQELVTMRWPDNTHILAFDREPEMIRNVWPHHRLSNAAALCANWLSLPLMNGYADLVLGDGALTLLAFPGEYRQLAWELARVLAPGGMLAARMYVAPDRAESVDDIFSDLWGGRIGNFSTFKWRLAMALLDRSDYSVSVNDVWEVWQARVESAEKLSEALGWPLPVIRMIERYRGCVTVRYSFPPLEQVCDAFAPLFRPEETVFPSYQDGERYPTVCFRKM